MNKFDELKKLRERLRREDQCLIGYWEWNIPLNKIAWNVEVFKIFGMKPRDFAGTYESFLDTVDPKDRKKVMDAVDKAIKEAEPYSIEHGIILPGGKRKRVLEQATVFYNDNGNPTKMSGTVKEIIDYGSG